MSLPWSLEYVNIVLKFALIVRLLKLRFYRVYRAFWLFLISELSVSLIGSFNFPPFSAFDYRITWILCRPVIWIFTLWTVYALLDAVLANLPGILGFSRKLLNFVFVGALGIALLSAIPEYSASGTAGFATSIDRVLGTTFVLDRVICTVALLVLVAILGFLFWFPVEISKNLVVFSTGFLVYFATKSGLWLARSFWSHESLRLVNDLMLVISGACFAYWTIFITPQGESVPVTLGHGWDRTEQDRLIGQLESMNASLLRAAARR